VSCYFTEGVINSSYLVNASSTAGNATELFISNSVFTSIAAMTNPLVTINNATTGTMFVKLMHNDFLAEHDEITLLCEGSQESNIQVIGNLFYPPQNTTLTNPVVKVTGTGPCMTFVGNQALDQGTGSSTLLNFLNDNNHIVEGNQFRGRGLALPSPFEGTYVSGNTGIPKEPSLAWAIDGSGKTLTVTTGGNVALGAGSGMIMVVAQNHGNTPAIYMVGGGVATLLTPPSGIWVSPTVSPATGKACVTWDGSTAYRLYNNVGSSLTAGFVMLRGNDGN
jgi:hypothetical protein